MMNARFGRKTGGFARIEHIKRASEIRNLFKNGKRASVSGAKLFFLSNEMGFNRIAFPLSRGFGCAVARNRSKRFSREAYRLLKAHLSVGFDMLLLVYPDSENDSFQARCAQLRTLCEKAALLKPNFSENHFE